MHRYVGHITVDLYGVYVDLCAIAIYAISPLIFSTSDLSDVLLLSKVGNLLIFGSGPVRSREGPLP